MSTALGGTNAMEQRHLFPRPEAAAALNSNDLIFGIDDDWR
jgi:hypothetical protein